MTRRRAVTVVMSLVAALVGLVVSAAPASATTFSNTGSITVADGHLCLNCADPGVATPYPSTIAVSGMTGTVSDVTVTLTNVSHPFPGDLDVLLVGPAGQRMVLVSDSGSSPSSNVTLTLSDAAATSLPAGGAWTSGTYKPTSRASGPADIWPAPAPAGPYANSDGSAATLGSTFNGTDPNGTWSLYIVDDALGDTGSVAGGWSLSVTTAGLLSTTTTVTSSDNPSTTGQSVTFTATVSHGGSPVTAGAVSFTDNGTALGGPVPLDGSGHATLTTSALTEGAHTITSTYNGSGTYAQSSGTRQQTVDNPTTKVGSAFCNTGNLAIQDGSGGPTAGNPYPSHVSTSGLTGVVDAVSLSLDGVTHPYADDLDLLLVGPGGQTLVVVSDAGGPTSLSSVSPTFRDGAASAFGTSGGWGAASRPVDHGTGDVFPAPAPSGPYGEPAPAGSATFASVFRGKAPNGQWSLYVVDDALGGSGTISGGWCLDVTTRTPVVAHDDDYATAKNNPLSVAAPGVLVNDTPAPLTAAPISGGPTAQGGSVTLAADGHFTYTPAAGFTGNDTFTYQATDGVTNDSATVTVHVSNAPSLNGATVARRQGDAATSSTVATVSDVETAPGNLTVALGTLPAGISVTNLSNSAGTVTAQVAASCTAGTGNTPVPISVTDGDGYRTDGSFTVDVLANAAPTLTYAPANRVAGQASTVDPATGPSDGGGPPGLSVLGGATTYPGAVSVAPDGTVSLPGAPAGDYVVTVRAVDGCGASTDAVLDVHVGRGNVAPVADAGGPYALSEGDGVTLDGSHSSDADGDPLTFTWDVNGDGTFGDATGATPHLGWTDLQALDAGDGDHAFDVALKVSDGSATDVDHGSLTLANTAPVVAGPDTVDVTKGEALTVPLTATDPSGADTAAGLTWDVDWGDGTTGTSLTHTYDELGTFIATVTASDKDGGVSAPVSVLVTVAGTETRAESCGSGKALVISGTSGPDTILVRSASGGGLVVSGLGAPHRYTGTSAVHVHGNGGGDHITVAPDLKLRRYLYGDAGDDTVTGGRGVDVLVGGDGSDDLDGRKARDVLIGGNGADHLGAGKGSDLLVAGSTDYDGSPPTDELALCKISRVWSSRTSYAERVGILDGPGGSPVLVAGTTVADDTEVDALMGDLGHDWFLLNRTGAGARDTSDRAPGETATDL